MYYYPIFDRVYCSDGVNSGIIQNGVYRSFGLALPLIPTVMAVAGGNLIAGTYAVATTYVRNDFQESGTSGLSEVVAVDGQALSITYSASSDQDVSWIRIYITHVDGDVLYLASTLPNANGTYVYINDTSELGVGCVTGNLDPMPAGIFPTIQFERMWITDYDTLWFSLPFFYEICNMNQGFIRFSEPITMVLAIQEVLYVGTSGATYALKVENGTITTSTVGPFTFMDSGIYLDGSWVGNGSQKGIVGMWAGEDGIFVGGEDGNPTNITADRYFPRIHASASSFTLNYSGLTLCVFTFSNSTSLVVNLKTFALSTFGSGFNFNSGTTLNGVAYVANANGIFIVGGSLDVVTSITGSFTTSTSELAVDTLQNSTQGVMKRMENAYVDALSSSGFTFFTSTENGVSVGNTETQTSAVIKTLKVRGAKKGQKGVRWYCSFSATAPFVVEKIELLLDVISRRINST
jgi:hypothetical protein